MKKIAATVSANRNGESLGSEEKYQQNAPPTISGGEWNCWGRFDQDSEEDGWVWARGWGVSLNIAGEPLPLVHAIHPTLQ
jgi:hypothetical protein